MVTTLNILLNIWGAQTRSDPVLDDMYEVIESKPCWNPVKSCSPGVSDKETTG